MSSYRFHLINDTGWGTRVVVVGHGKDPTETRVCVCIVEDGTVIRSSFFPFLKLVPTRTNDSTYRDIYLSMSATVAKSLCWFPAAVMVVVVSGFVSVESEERRHTTRGDKVPKDNGRPRRNGQGKKRRAGLEQLCSRSSASGIRRPENAGNAHPRHQYSIRQLHNNNNNNTRTKTPPRLDTALMNAQVGHTLGHIVENDTTRDSVIGVGIVPENVS